MQQVSLRWLSVLSFALLMLAGCQSIQEVPGLTPAAYNEDEDVYIVFQGQVFEDAAAFLPAQHLADLALALQEGTHESITDLSGAEIDHYYVWVCLGQACIPVDPFSYSG